jgi:hypothetical protein
VAYSINPNRHEINEVWFGEGFSPIEVVELLGLDPAQFDSKDFRNPSNATKIKKILEVYSTK